MTSVRSWLAANFVLYLSLLAAYALVQLVRGAEPILSWFGLLLSTLGPLTYFAWRRTGKTTQIRSHPLANTS